MWAYIIKRLIFLIPILFVVSILVFLLIHMIPGDPAVTMLGTEAANPETLEAMRKKMGLDQPVYVQYGIWLQNVLTGNFGKSISSGKTVMDLLSERYPFTVELALYALILSVVIAIPLGTLAAITRSKWVGFIFQFFTLIGLSLPTFWSGIMFILVFSVYLRWFPIVNFPSLADAPLENLKAFFLPAITLALPNIAAIARVVRASLLDVRQRDYVKTARAKGLAEGIVVYKHMLKNAMIPIITLIGIIAGYLMGGVIIVEHVFAIPGLGRLGVESITGRDYPLLQMIVLFGVVSFVFVNLIVDVLYIFLNPKIRYD